MRENACRLTEFCPQTKVINSYLNVIERAGAGDEDSQPHYQIFELLGYNHRAKLVLFVGQSLSTPADAETAVAEQDMRPNVYAFSIDHSTVHCLTCQLVRCYQRKQHDPDHVCIGWYHWSRAGSH